MRCPLVPLNVKRAFWAGVVSDTVTLEPPGTIDPDTSAGTSYTVTVVAPVLGPVGLTSTVYVPVTGSVLASMNPPMPLKPADAKVLPSGLSTDRVPLLIVDVPVLTLTRWPLVPGNVNRTFWPGVVTEMGTAGPPGTIGPVTSGGTLYSVVMTLPVYVLFGSIRMV